MALIFRFITLTTLITVGLAYGSKLADVELINSEIISTFEKSIDKHFDHSLLTVHSDEDLTGSLAQNCHHSSGPSCSGCCLLSYGGVSFLPHRDIWVHRADKYYKSCFLTGLKRPPKLTLLSFQV